MEVKRRTQEERSTATRTALTTAARRLWGERGYVEVGTPEIASAAGVTRGAMYHQFSDKAALFLAVIEDLETDVMSRLSSAVVASEPSSPAAALRVAAERWLEISTDPEVRRLLLLDAPSVLGWDGFRDVAERHHLGATEQLLADAISAGQLPPQPVGPLAHILIAALDEAAMLIANAADPGAAHAEVQTVLRGLFDALLDDR